MGATPYALLTQRVRILCNDTSNGNPHFGETPQGIRNGTNTTFRLAFTNPVAGAIYLTYGSSIIRQPAGATTFVILDAPSGYVTVTPGGAPPDAGTTQPLYFDYFSQLYLDADYQTMLDQGTDWLGGVAGTDVAEGLYPAQCWFAASMFFSRRASEKAPFFASSGGGLGVQPQTPAQAFTKLADWALGKAVAARDDFYKRQGQRLAPASGSIHYGMSTGQTPY